MIRFAEAVLPGHPDKFCDQIADGIVAEAIKTDQYAFAQIEVSVWADQAWLSGNIVTRKPLLRTPADILIETGLSIGFDKDNWIDASRYQITDTICQNIDDPSEGRTICDDQSIVIGYAGYDSKTYYLPPEQFLAHSLKTALWQSCLTDLSKGLGPDGKVLISLREEGSQWYLEKILVTIQHSPSVDLLQLTSRVQSALKSQYDLLREQDSRWTNAWNNIDVMINPNGPYHKGGSDGDNGQTGRKLVMDYYGPRIPIGGGALSGKHAGHIDRLAAYTTRSAALHAVKTGARDCLIKIAYAPNHNNPLEVIFEMNGKGERRSNDFFNFDQMLEWMDPYAITGHLGAGTHFMDLKLPWNI